MKKVCIAGILALVSSLWAIAISAYVEMNLADSWMDFRLLESAVKNGVIVPWVLSMVLLACSGIYLLAAFFRKDK